MRLAARAIDAGGTWPAVYNAANEEAVAAFLAGGIRFPQIVDTVAEVLDGAADFARPAETVSEVLDVEKHARRLAGQILNAKG